jgi:hypothetical protein
MDWMAEESWLDSWQEQEIFLLQTSRLALEPNPRGTNVSFTGGKVAKV